jgi:hypothetical protein
LTNGRLTGLSIVLTIGFSTTGVALLELENQSPKEALALVKIKIVVIIIK